MTTTKTTYQVESHEYTEITPCTSPETCTKRSHWEISAEDIPADEVETWTTVNDHPAVRVSEYQPED